MALCRVGRTPATADEGPQKVRFSPGSSSSTLFHIHEAGAESTDLTANFLNDHLGGKYPPFNDCKRIKRPKHALTHWGGPVWTQVLRSVLPG